MRTAVIIVNFLYSLKILESVKKVCKFGSFYDRIEIYHRRNFLWQKEEEKK